MAHFPDTSGGTRELRQIAKGWYVNVTINTSNSNIINYHSRAGVLLFGFVGFNAVKYWAYSQKKAQFLQERNELKR